MAAAPQARSVYRALIRASNSTFGGDVVNQQKFHAIIRETFLSPTLTPSSFTLSTAPPPPPPTSCSSGSSSSSNPPPPSKTSSSTSTTSNHQPSTPTTQITLEEYHARLKHWKDVAEMLKRNVVQGSKIEDKSTESDAAYRLRITKHTELGDNETIKKPAKLPTTPFPNRAKRNRVRRTATGTGNGMEDGA